MLLHARRLQHIRISADRVIFKRGVTELLVAAPDIASCTEMILEMLDGTHTREQILESFPGSQRPELDNLLSTMMKRGLITEEPDELAEDLNEPQRAFWSNFGSLGRESIAKIAQSKVTVCGANLVSRSLVRSLLEMNLEQVTLVRHPALDNQHLPLNWEFPESVGRLEVLERLPPEDVLHGISVLCATSDFGCPDALLELNRATLRLEKPYLPVWLADLVGHVGPLNHPFQSACLRCYQARLDSNSPYPDAAQAIRTQGVIQPGAGMLPPMAAILGEIAAIEVVKCIGGFPPCDVVGRAIDINLTSFASSVRRVLKLPRCPECSDVMRQASMTVIVGPQVPYSDHA